MKNNNKNTKFKENDKETLRRKKNQLALQITYTVNTKNETQNVKITLKTNRYYIIYDKPEQKQHNTTKNITYQNNNNKKNKI